MTAKKSKALDKAHELAAGHWQYVKELLELSGSTPVYIAKIGFHYKSAFIHGYKHGQADKEE